MTSKKIGRTSNLRKYLEGRAHERPIGSHVVRLVRATPRLELMRRQGLAEQVALRLVASEIAQVFHRFFRLDTFTDDLQIESASQSDDGLGDGATALAFFISRIKDGSILSLSRGGLPR